MHNQIQDLMNQGKIYEAIKVALNYVLKVGTENSQLELFLLAKCYFAIQDYHKSLYYLRLTNADPIEKIPFQEELEAKLNI
jgi:hypothetical protein